MKLKLFCILLLSSISSYALAQVVNSADIYGTVRGYENNGVKEYLSSVPGATVQLTFGADSLFTTTNMDGIFLFKNLSPQKVHLKLFLLGKKTIEGDYEIEAGRNAFYFIMEDAAAQIDAAKIEAEAELSRKVADTTVYNVRLLNSLEGESARALLEQLPGFKINDAGITVDGQPVIRTYVNGVLIFGDHPVTAVDALKASEVAQVNVYDELSPEDRHRGLTHARKQRVLDIKTLEDIVSLTDAVLLAEAGADEVVSPRGQGLGAVAFWSEMANASAMAGWDNLSSPLQEMDRYSQSTPLELARKAQNHSQPLNTYSESLTAKVDFAKYWKDRSWGNSVKGSYSFGRNYLKTAENALTQYYRTAESPEMAYYDTVSSVNTTSRHLFRLFADLHDTPLKAFHLDAFGSIDTKSQSSVDIEKLVSGQTRLRNESAGSKNFNRELTVRSGWANNDRERFRPSVDLETQFTRERLASWKVDTMATSYLRCRLSTDGGGNGMNVNATARLSYVAFNNERHSLSINGQYRFSYRDIARRQMTIDSLDILNPQISPGSTFDFTWKDIAHNLSLDGFYSTSKLNISAGLSLADATVLGEDRFPEAIPTDKHYFAILPYLSLVYGNLNFKLATSNQLPALEQLRGYVSDANPLVLTAGNPLLKMSYSVDGQLHWTQPLKEHNGRLMLSLDGKCEFNPIVSGSRYFASETVLPEYFGYTAPAGAILYNFANAPTPAWSVNAAATYSGVFCSRKLIAQYGLLGAFKGIPQYVGEDIVAFKDMHLNLSALLRYTPSKKLKINFSPAVTYLHSSNSLGQNLAEAVNIVAPLSFDYNYLKHGFARITNRFGYNHYISGLGNDIATDYLSVTLGWKFLKNSLSVSISANDLLNASTKYMTTATAQYFSQRWTPASGRYYLLSVLYEFRKPSIPNHR